MAKSYKIMVVANNSWNTDGSAIIERECDHSHRTLSGAWRCHKNLTNTLSDGTQSAAWFSAEIRNADGSCLTDAEAKQLSDMDYQNENY